MSNKGTILIIGASSGIAEAFAFEACKKGYKLILCGRDMKRLELTANDICIRTCTEKIPCFLFDSRKTDSHKDFLNNVLKIEPRIHGVLIAAGIMPDQKECERDFQLCRDMIETNYLGLVSIMNILADYFEKEKTGFISCISSVAGERGRKSNYIYASTKAALNEYLSGVRCRLFKSNILVQTVKPGPVDTKMTKGLPKLPLLAKPEPVARYILKSIEQKKEIIFVPAIWKYIMMIIKMIPLRIFKRMGM